MFYEVESDWQERIELEEHRAYLEANSSAGTAEFVRVGKSEGVEEIVLRMVLLDDLERRAAIPAKGEAVRAFWRDMGFGGWSSVDHLRDFLLWTIDSYRTYAEDRVQFAEKLLTALEGLDSDCLVWFDHHPWNGEHRNLRDFDLKVTAVNATGVLVPSGGSNA